jgi:hypothetical protein
MRSTKPNAAVGACDVRGVGCLFCPEELDASPGFLLANLQSNALCVQRSELYTTVSAVTSPVHANNPCSDKPVLQHKQIDSAVQETQNMVARCRGSGPTGSIMDLRGSVNVWLALPRRQSLTTNRPAINTYVQEACGMGQYWKDSSFVLQTDLSRVSR